MAALHRLPPDDSRGYFAIITVGDLVLVIFGHAGDAPPIVDFETEPHRALVSISAPVGIGAGFPPNDMRLTAAQVEELLWTVQRWIELPDGPV